MESENREVAETQKKQVVVSLFHQHNYQTPFENPLPTSKFGS